MSYYKFYFDEIECRTLQCALFSKLHDKGSLTQAETKLLALLVDRDLVGPVEDDDDDKHAPYYNLAAKTKLSS